MRKVGIVGANGIGKSSLLALIYGDLQQDQGEITAPKRDVIACVAQEMPDTDRPAIEFVLDGDIEFREIMNRLCGLTPQSLEITEGHPGRARLLVLMERLSGRGAGENPG